jgi:phosphoribosylaminoimidazole-succinocarboxamide synthase
VPDLPLPLLARGKVRELYEVDDDHLLLVASDRCLRTTSSFRRGAGQGRRAHRLSVWWFEQLADLVPNHLVTARVASSRTCCSRTPTRCAAAPCCAAAEMVPVECVARGYLTGAG